MPLYPFWSLSTLEFSANPQYTPDTPYTPKQPLQPLGASQFPLMPPIHLLVPDYLESLLDPQYTLTPQTTPIPLGSPQCPLYPFGPSVPRVTASTKWSLLKFTPQVSYFQFEGKLELKFTPPVETVTDGR